MYPQNSQLTFISSKLTLETLEQDSKYNKVKKKDTKLTSNNCVHVN